MTTEVVPGIYHLPLPIPAPSPDHVNAYLVRDDNECLLIDTGWDTKEAFDSLKAQLTEIGISFEDISQIVVTHIHPDHYGLAGRLKQLSQARIAMHYLEKDFIKSRYINMDRLVRQLGGLLQANGVPSREAAQLSTASVRMTRFVTPTLPDITLRGGEIVSSGSFNFHVLWTPGHSPGHISLYEPQRKVLVSGDHILPDITPNIALHPQSGPNPLSDYLSSLDAIKQLEVSLVLPGHGQPFTGAKQRIGQLIRHHGQRKSEILKALDATSKTAYQIATNMTWKQDADSPSWSNLGPWGKRMAVLETLSHLEAMRIGEKLDKLTQDGTIYYQRKR
jgi:glyoxylase-like metal-dependent hydrolase (beta-lactamase superfamily II)